MITYRKVHRLSRRRLVTSAPLAKSPPGALGALARTRLPQLESIVSQNSPETYKTFSRTD